MLGVRVLDHPMMNRSNRCRCLCALLSLMLCPCPRAAPAESSESAQAKAKLAEVRGRIAALTGRLGSRLADRDMQAARLRQAELDVTAKRRRVEALHLAEAAAERRRSDLRVELANNQALLETQQAALAAQVRAAYMMGVQEELKLLLNQSDPAGAGRMLVYFGYLARARAANIQGIREQLEHGKELAVAVAEAGGKLQLLQAETAGEMRQLQQARDARLTALTAATRQVSSGKHELEQLKHQEQAEESLLADLAHVLQDFPVGSQQSFAGLRGKLPWPVPGTMTARYRDPRGNGVLIDSSRGAKVRAAYFGRVVYADWLQGLGLLLIIGHNGNYMTLYGHAEVLYKSVGDWVAPGDVIAALSDTGGPAPQLYFEIRDGRIAVDPKAWLRASP